VVVAANRLGVLNHTLLTVDAIASQGLEVAGVILNDGLCDDPELARWNLEDLHRELTMPIVVLPKINNHDHLVKVGEQLWAEM
jgi:dethiobiotin synthetase